MWYLIPVLVTTIVTVGAIASAWWMTRPVRRLDDEADESLPPISVLKPLCGADDHLEANLESFFALDYPAFELVFGVEGVNDPAIAVVRELQSRYPEVTSRLVVHKGGWGLNPKVSNLRATLGQVSHDLVVISDSNVLAPADYLRGMAREMVRPGVGLVTSLFTGVGERTLGAFLDNLHMVGTITPSVALSAAFGGKTFVVGKSMMFRRSVFHRLGGFESVATVLAEDYVMGRMFRAAGYQVRLSRAPVNNVCVNTSVTGFLKRNVRWSAMRCRLQPLLYPLELMANPVAVALVAPLFGISLATALLWAATMIVFRDLSAWFLLRGPGHSLAVVVAGPLKDAALLVVWCLAPFQRRLRWRGKEVRLSAGTRLYAASPLHTSAR